MTKAEFLIGFPSNFTIDQKIIKVGFLRLIVFKLLILSAFYRWFRLLDKQGKPDKDRGEVLLDIQFMRNNMTASMFDLSAAGKSRSRLGKFKDKVRGKKKESDSSSGVVPALTQVMTDSEEEANGDGEEAAKKDGKSKKLKVKSLFSSKSNLQKTMSQSMSVLPVKNSSLSGSQSSGLNVDPSEGKKKFKFKIHKRSGSSDSKDLSFGNQKRPSVEQSNMCINGSHVYCEEPQPRTSRAGSNFSLASSGHGSMEDVPDNSSPSLDSLRAVRQYSPWMEEEEEEEEEKQETENQSSREDEAKMEEEEEVRRKKKEEEDILKRQEELKRIVQRKEEEKLAEEEKIREEERQRLAEEKRRLEEEEEKKLEEEEKRREEEKMKEEERKAQEEEERRREEEFKLAQKMRIEEEKRMEELRRQKEEEEFKLAEKMRIEEEKRMEELRRQREEEEFKLAEKMRIEEEKRMEELRRQREEEERIEEIRRKEEEDMIRRQKEQEEMRRKEEEELLRRQEEEKQKEYERKKREDEMRKKEEEDRARKQKEIEEMKRKEEEEMLRRQEELERELEEERLRLEEEAREAEKERLKREEEERIRVEEEIQRKEEETRLKELERLRQEEEERMRREEQERIEEKRRREDAEKARKEKEENERLAQQRRLEEQKKIEEEEKLRKEEEERKLKEEQRAAELISTNPFDEETPNFSSESQNQRVKEETVNQRCDPALVSEGSRPVSCEETDPIRTQREKRPAPRPPGSDQDGSQRWKAQDVAEQAQINKLNPESDVKTGNVVSARLMKKIPPADSKNTQSSTPTSEVITAKHGKRPAPTRPQPAAKDSSELKTISSAGKIPQMGATGKEQVLPIHGLNPFEDELSDQEDSSVSAPVCWPPALTADGVKLKSSKMARAPAPPAKSDASGGDDLINKGLADTNDQQRDGAGHMHVNNGPNKDSQHMKTPEKPPSSCRLLPVKPLNPSDQPSTSLFQEDTKSPGIGYELQAKNKADDTVMTGPYSQLTREELICLVLKQESQLLEKQGKISELEQYIDNLLVRVIEEQPSILMSLSAAPKKVA
ncbi:calponin homology domain-containing protein DDB_G0272472 [Oryzias melastigma]|uniref:calponin homology domain-containing protein DDB_G0272472 n=1 Tax=Oryzias melastigma TaxID=30732 RepID=UPI00168CE14A|nr:calponin homology domain-containing protein DDB_G0272472 [Oryzias melastigma]